MATMKSIVGLILDAVSNGGNGGGSGVFTITAMVDGDGLTLQAPASIIYTDLQDGSLLPIVCLPDDVELNYDFIASVYEGENGLTFSTMTGKHYVAAQPSDYPTTKTSGSSTGPK